MYVVLFHRYDRLGANLINYICQIIYAHYNGYYIKIIDNEYNHTKYPNSKFYIILLNYINNVLNINNFGSDQPEGRQGSAGDEILYNFNKYDVQLFCGFVTQTIKCDLITYFHEHIYNNLDFDDLNNFYNNISYDFNNSIFCHLRLDDVSHKKDYDGKLCSMYYKLLIENDKPCVNKFYEYVNNHSPLSNDKINIMLDDAINNYPNDKIYMVTSPISNTDFNKYDIISNDDVDKDLFILCNSKKIILSRSLYALSSLFFSKKKEYCYTPSWGFFVVCGLNTKYDKNSLKYIY